MTTAELFDLLIDRAPKLRAAGVRSVQIDGLRVDIDPSEPVIAMRPNDNEEERVSSDPLDDPATFGRSEGTPGFDLSDLDNSDER